MPKVYALCAALLQFVLKKDVVHLDAPRLNLHTLLFYTLLSDSSYAK